MDIVNAFKNYLFSQKNAPTAITVKNYLSDVRKFITWYQKAFNIPFVPQDFTAEVLMRYQQAMQGGIQASLPAARSAKRYLSSLRKFSAFLEHSGMLSVNPFLTIERPQTISDPFFLKEFTNFLFSEHASKLTIKNYVTDIKQFLSWLERVTDIHAGTSHNELILKINNNTLEEFKTRFYHEAKLSPVSINRKLSSMRRYIRWLNEKGIINVALVEPSFESEERKAPLPVFDKPSAFTHELPLTVLQGLAQEAQEKEITKYSRLAPFRLIQKTKKAITLGTDLLIFNPIAHAAEAINYTLWKKGKREVFASVATILKASAYIPQGSSVKTIIPKAASIMPPQTAKLASVIDKMRSYSTENATDTVRNFTKALYAPLEISTDQMHWSRKAWHYLRHRRPTWYKTYHAYAFVHYAHLAILFIATIIAGSALYQTWNSGSTSQSQAVLSAQATAPPRTLSFQGRLLDKTNTPITAETPLRFALYNSPTASGAALLWQEKQDIKPNQNGYFTATLGKFSRLNQSVFSDNSSVYIGIAINGNQELTPRQQIPTTNYAANAQSVEGMKPITDSPNLAQNVVLALDSSGNLTIGGNASHMFQATGGQFGISGQTLLLTTNPGSNGNVTIAPDGSGIIDLQKPLQNTSNYSSPGGIPGAVEVKDILSVLATSSSQSALVVNQNGTGDIISGKSNGTDKFRLDRQGNAFLTGDIILAGDTIGTTSNIFDIAGTNVTNLILGNNASVVSIGGRSGITAIDNNLAVRGTSTLSGAVTTNGLLTANAGIVVPAGQKLTLTDFTPGALPFINSNNQIVQDAASFSWNDTNKQIDIAGSICLYTNTVCDSSHATTGTIYMNSAQTYAGDLAEDYVSSQHLEPGDVVALEGLQNNNAIIKSSQPYQHELIGIVSTEPGITLNSQAKTDSEHPNIYPLALQGRVPVKVSSINGSIQAGDDLTSSTIPGVAMKASETGQIIGKALEGYANPDASASGKIMAFVTLSYRSSPTTITTNGNLGASLSNDQITQTPIQAIEASQLDGFTKSIALAMLQAGEITSQSLHMVTDNITINGQPLSKYVAAIVEKVINKPTGQLVASKTDSTASESAQTTDQTSSPTASSSGNLTNTASPSASLYNSIASPSATASFSAKTKETSHSATGSGSLKPGTSPTPSLTPEEQSLINSLGTETIENSQYEPVASLAGQITSIANLQAGSATFNQGLIALGPTSLTDAAVSDMLLIHNNLRITANSFDTIASDLNIQPLKQGNVRFMGGLVAINTQGDLTVNGNATFAHNVQVKGTLAAGIIAPIPNQDLAINLPTKANKQGSSLVVTSASGSGVLKINQTGDVTSSGAAQFGTIASQGFSIVRGAEADTSTTQTITNNSAGKGTITAHETERTIFTPYVTDHSLIYITATSNTGKVTPYLARQTAPIPAKGIQGSFTVAIPVSVTKDISFNWWIVN